MRYQVTMTIDIEEVREKAITKKSVVTAVPEEKQHSPETSIGHLVYGIKDAALALGIGRTFLFQLIKEGKLPFVKLGRRTLIQVSELQALLNGGIVTPGSPAVTTPLT